MAQYLAAPGRPPPCSVLQTLAIAGFTCDLRLEPDNFSSQSARAGFNQGLSDRGYPGRADNIEQASVTGH